MQGDLCEEWRSDLEIISFHHEVCERTSKDIHVFKRRGTTWDCCNTIPSFHGILKDRYWKGTAAKMGCFSSNGGNPSPYTVCGASKGHRKTRTLPCRVPAKSKPTAAALENADGDGWASATSKTWMTTLTLIPSQQSQSHWSIWSKLENLGLIWIDDGSDFNSMKSSKNLQLSASRETVRCEGILLTFRLDLGKARDTKINISQLILGQIPPKEKIISIKPSLQVQHLIWLRTSCQLGVMRSHILRS